MELISRELSLLDEGKAYEFSQNIYNKAKRLLMKKEYPSAMAVALVGTKKLMEKREREATLQILEIIVAASAHTEVDVNDVEYISGMLPSPHDTTFLSELAKITSHPYIYNLLARNKEESGSIGESMVILM